MKKITIYTDGSCSGNPGPGGWAALLIYNDHKKEISGGEANTTNNRMEMLAAIEAIKAVKSPSELEIYTDSVYLKNGVTTWIHSWKRNGWKTSDKKEVKNQDLWKEIDKFSSIHKINWFWVKGHSNNEFNNYVDVLAVEACKKIKRLNNETI